MQQASVLSYIDGFSRPQPARSFACCWSRPCAAAPVAVLMPAHLDTASSSQQIDVANPAPLSGSTKNRPVSEDPLKHRRWGVLFADEMEGAGDQGADFIAVAGDIGEEPSTAALSWAKVGKC
jgi:hypothetical protein